MVNQLHKGWIVERTWVWLSNETIFGQAILTSWPNSGLLGHFLWNRKVKTKKYDSFKKKKNQMWYTYFDVKWIIEKGYSIFFPKDIFFQFKILNVR